MNGDGTFYFSGQDSLSQFMAWIIVLGASGVVVKLAGKEVVIGSRNSMHELHAALFSLRANPAGR